MKDHAEQLEVMASALASLATENPSVGAGSGQLVATLMNAAEHLRRVEKSHAHLESALFELSNHMKANGFNATSKAILRIVDQGKSIANTGEIITTTN